jgi:hypothetical protein
VLDEHIRWRTPDLRSSSTVQSDQTALMPRHSAHRAEDQVVCLLQVAVAQLYDPGPPIRQYHF